MATHSTILVWRIPWTEEPGRLQSMGLLRVRHDWVTNPGVDRKKEKEQQPESEWRGAERWPP